MLNCKQATFLMSQDMDKELPLLQKAGLRLHLVMCKGCRNFHKQTQFLRKCIQKFPQE